MLNVVIADDEKIAREGIRDLVDWKALNMQVVFTAENGREVLDYFRTHRVDILLTDIRMPQMDGLEVIQALQEYPQSPAVVIFSGFDDFQYAQQAIHYGVISYLLKPIRLEELAEALRKAAERYRTTSAQNPGEEELIRYKQETRHRVHLELEQIARAITSGDQEEMNRRLDEVCALMISGGYSTGMIRRFAFSAVYRLSHLLTEMAGEEIAMTEEMDSLSEFAIAQEGEQILRQLRGFVEKVQQRIAQKMQRGRKKAVQDTLEAIARRYACETLSVQLLAEEFGITPNYLSSLFRQQVGKTFSEYLEDYRMEKAKGLLRDTRLKIYEIAEEVGYEDGKYFGRVFKERTGVTPLEYRNRNV